MLQQKDNIPAYNGVLTLGPRDHGRVLSLAEYRSAVGLPGYVYELIDGVLIVSPNPLPNHDYWVRLVRRQLEAYGDRHPSRINCVTEASELEVPRRAGPTRPQPDLAAYRDYPDPAPKSWDDVCPIIVVEVISERRAEKDTVRNRHLYWEVRGIREYWIVDPTDDSTAPTLIALHRAPKARDWKEQTIAFGKTYRCPTLPGFALNLKAPPGRKSAKRRRSSK